MAKRLTVKTMNKELEEFGLNLVSAGSKKYKLFNIEGEQAVELDLLQGTLNEINDQVKESYLEETEVDVAQKTAGLTMKTQFENLSVFTKLLTKGSKKMEILAGPPGIGKSYEIVQSLNENVGAHGYHIIKGKTSAIEVYNTLFNFNKHVVVFDDCDSLFDNSDAINVLMAATDKNHKTGKYQVNWNTNTKLVDTHSFEFEGKVIVITNRDFKKASMKKSRPLVSRSFFIQFHNNREEILERTRDIASKKEIFGLNEEERMEVVDYIASFDDFTPDLRLYEDVAQVRSEAKVEGYDWKIVAQSTIEAQQFLCDDN